MRRAGKTLTTAIYIKQHTEKGETITLITKDVKNLKNILENLNCFCIFTKIKKDGELIGYNITEKL